MNTIRAAFGAILVGLAAIAPASAQERITLRPGSAPDPAISRVNAGGPRALGASDGARCAGFVTREPTALLSYEAGSEERLFISARPRTDRDADLVLMVQTPDGRTMCSDDSFGSRNLNPGWSFARPRSGTYRIWVGNLGEAQDDDWWEDEPEDEGPEIIAAELHISVRGYGVTETEVTLY